MRRNAEMDLPSGVQPDEMLGVEQSGFMTAKRLH
jgi:hypothetical protein